MLSLSEDAIAQIVTKVIRELKTGGSAGPLAAGGAAPPGAPVPAGPVFPSVEQAVAASARAQPPFYRLGPDQRREIIEALRRDFIAEHDRLARMAHEETRMGRYEHKKVKNYNAAIKTPGVEDIAPTAVSGDGVYGLVERVPYGVVASLTPSTHPVATAINHIIAVLAGGNSLIVFPHPRAAACSQETVRVANQAIVRAGGPPNVVTILERPSIEAVDEMLRHRTVKLVIATGGPAVAKAAMTSGKKAIVGGPGNPPVLVDETANFQKAARDIIAGGGFDNNILCIGEKAIVAQRGVTPQLVEAMQAQGGQLLSAAEAAKVTELVIKDDHVAPEWTGQNCDKILHAAGIACSPDTMLAVFRTDDPDHPLVTLEQMMPVVPILEYDRFEAGVEICRRIEHGFGHTAIIHSRNSTRIKTFEDEMGCQLVIANAPSYACLGVEGAGPYAHTIAGPTGEGVCTARTFTRERRLTVNTRA